MRSIFVYVQERFPIPQVLLFAVGYASLALGTVLNENIWLADPREALRKLILLTGVFSFFLLRQRVTDEFKDEAHDLKNFPDRPVPRGLVSKKQLTSLGFFSLIGEVVFVYHLGMKAAVAYIFVFLYSILMAREFFLEGWLRQHFTLDFLIHEVIFLLFGIFFVFALGGVAAVSIKNLLLILGILMMAPVTIEVIRKFSPRYDKEDRVVKDTYSTVWGREKALFVLMGSALFLGLSLTLLKNSAYFLLFSFITILICLTLGRKLDKIVIATGAIAFLGNAFLVNIIW